MIALLSDFAVSIDLRNKISAKFGCAVCIPDRDMLYFYAKMQN